MAEVIVPVTVHSARASGSFDFEHTIIIYTDSTDKHWSLPLTQIQRIGDYIDLYGSVELRSLEVEVNQISLIGSDDDSLVAQGVCFVGVIPSKNDNADKVGKTAANVISVPRKRFVSLSSTTQISIVHKLDISGFENDLAQDARRGQAPVMWFGNSGVSSGSDTGEIAICSLTWRGVVDCSGSSTLW